MSIERKNPPKRDQALNDATGGQMGEQPRPQPSKPTDDNLNEQRLRALEKCRETCNHSLSSFTLTNIFKIS